MLSLQKSSDKIKGIEILYFEDAELQKVRGVETSFATFGPLSLLYFKDYNRFALQLNDWNYPLMRRLPISSCLSQDDASSRTYVLPAANGFSFSLKINKVTNSQSFDNLETILDKTSRFSVIGKEIPYRKFEESPDEKLPRKGSKDTSPKEMITELAKQVFHQAQNKLATLKTGTNNLTSTKKMVSLKDIKNKNYRKEAKSRIKKGFLQSSQKLSNELSQRRGGNNNITQAREFDDLLKTSDKQAPALYINKEEIEEAILNNKRIFDHTTPELEKSEEKKGLIGSLKEGVQNIRERVSGLVSRERNLVAPEVQGLDNRMPISEDLSHYQG